MYKNTALLSSVAYNKEHEINKLVYLKKSRFYILVLNPEKKFKDIKFSKIPDQEDFNPKVKIIISAGVENRQI